MVIAMLELNKIHQGHTLDLLKQMDSDSIDCVITSPPYYGLRAYPNSETIWDGDKNCQHNFSIKHHKSRGGGDPTASTQVGNNKEILHFCQYCDAWKGQLGLEPDYRMYLNHVLQITAELKRVLKPQGTLWWNMGDTYSGSGQGGQTGYGDKKRQKVDGSLEKSITINTGINAKSLMQLPERLAIRMADEQGWILRNAAIWHKPNHMPSSVKDRLAGSYEFVYLFVKNRKYYFNLDAIRIPIQIHENRPFGIKGIIALEYNHPNPAGKNPGDIMEDFWTITTQPHPFAHFAVYPEKLVEPMIKAGCPEEVCSQCGKPKVPVSKPTEEYAKILKENKEKGLNQVDWYPRQTTSDRGSTEKRITAQYYVAGYQPTCSCSTDEYTGILYENKPLKVHVPFLGGVVLDPFAGSATTCLVAQKLKRQWIGLEINPEYIKIAEERLRPYINQKELINK